MILLILFLILSSSLLKSARATIPQEECQALRDLHSKTQGKHWHKKWRVAKYEGCQTACNWYGVQCNYLRTHIVGL